jgi:transposase
VKNNLNLLVEIMKKSRRKFSSAFKTQVVIEAIKERESLAELAKRFEIHPNMISLWKKEFMSKAADVFESKSHEPDSEKEKQELYAKIGQLEMEKEWLKKNLNRIGL